MADSNIQELLTSILNTRLGKDMRQAIHDSIAQCYDDVTSPELNVKAFEQAVQNKIDSGELPTMTIPDGSITKEKLDPNLELGVEDGSITSEKLTDDLLKELGILEGCRIRELLEYGFQRWDDKRISGTTVISANNYKGYILDMSKIKKEIRLVCNGTPSYIKIINESNPDLYDPVTEVDSPTSISAGQGGIQYTLTPRDGYLLLYKTTDFLKIFICEEINLSKDLDIPGGICVNGSLDFATKGTYTGFKLPDIPSGAIVFLKISDEVNLGNIQILDISKETAKGITTNISTINSAVICWISNGETTMLRYGKSNNVSFPTLYETMKISIVYLDQSGIPVFKHKHSIGNAIMCGIYANNRNDSLFLSLFADYLECDIQKSSDGKYVLNHTNTYSGLTISNTELITLQEHGIWTLDELYRFVSKGNLGLALDAKIEITDLDIRKTHAITKGKKVIVAGNQFDSSSFDFVVIHKKDSSDTGTYEGKVIYDADGTIDEPVLKNGLNLMTIYGEDLTNLSEKLNGLDVIEYDVAGVKATLTSLYECVF